MARSLYPARPAAGRRNGRPHGGATALAIAAVSLAMVPTASAAAFPGDNGLVVFSSNRIVGDEPTDEADEPITDFEIYSAPLDGGATQLTNNTVSISTEGEVETLAPIDDLWPAVSPDGSRIAFTRNYDPEDGSTDPDIYTMAMDGSDERQVTKNVPGMGGAMGAAEYEPAWSPDGTKLAFRRDDGINANIWMVDLATGQETQLTGLGETTPGPNAYDAAPAWSPDGTKIAYENGKGPTVSIWVLDVAAPENAAKVIDAPGASDASPSWSPDGTRIAFRRGDEGAGAGIWTAAAGGGSEVQLTDPVSAASTVTPTAEEEEPAAYSDLNPAWSPDGSQILFQSNRPTHEGEVVKGDPDIYVIKADGSDGLGGGTLLPASAVSEQVPPPPEEPIEEGPPSDVPPEDPGGEPALPDSDITPDWQTIATSNLAVSLVDTPDPVEAGQNVTYEATLANGGPSFTTGASLVLQVPSTTTFASVTSSQGVCTGQGPVSCVLGSMPPGSSAKVVMVVATTRPGAITAAATGGSDLPDPDESNNSATASTTVNESRAALAALPPVGGPAGIGGVCAAVPGRQGPGDGSRARFTVSRRQFLINQRIYQAAIRRANAVQTWLDAGIEARDICGGALGVDRFLNSVGFVGANGDKPVANPRPLEVASATRGDVSGVTVSRTQALINQRVAQAAIRRVNALRVRIEGALTGGDVKGATLTNGQLVPGLGFGTLQDTPKPAPSQTRIQARTGGSPGAVTLSATQARINQRIGQQAVLRVNALTDELKRGLVADNFAPASIGGTEVARP